MIEIHMAPAAEGERNVVPVVMEVGQMKTLSRELRKLIDSRVSDKEVKVIKLFGVVKNP
jgi:hypothetical protein